MKKISLLFVAFAVTLAAGFVSCTSEDDDEPISSEIKDLVSSVLPAEGWSGSSDNGILRFAPETYESDEPGTYFAFEMHNGTCQSAVYNVVMPSANEARQLAKMLNDGTWVDFDDDDDDYSSFVPGKNPDIAKRVLACVKRSECTRASVTLPIPVRQEGRVIYITITNFDGLSVADLRAAVNIWMGNSYEVPQRVVFGKYENGRYICHNMHGMDITYEINTAFNSSGFCTEYVTTLTLPTETWARFYYEAYEEQLDDFEGQFGQRPALNLNGKVVRLDAVIIGDVPHAEVDAMIYAIDWLNNCPFLCEIF